MSISSALSGVQAATDVLRRRTGGLVRMTDDVPADSTTVVVDLVRDACEDLDGWLVAVLESTARARSALPQRRLGVVAEALARCAEANEQALRSYVTGLGGVGSLDRLRQLAADRPASWSTWTRMVQDEIAQAWTDLSEIRVGVDAARQELTEHLLRDPIEVHASRLPARSHPLPDDSLVGGQQ